MIQQKQVGTAGTHSAEPNLSCLIVDPMAAAIAVKRLLAIAVGSAKPCAESNLLHGMQEESDALKQARLSGGLFYWRYADGLVHAQIATEGQDPMEIESNRPARLVAKELKRMFRQLHQIDLDGVVLP
jgi:hypothetical protein